MNIVVSLLNTLVPILQVRRDGTKMTLAQSKKLSQLTADNAQWEDRQLLRSGAVRGTEVQTEFDDEEERKVILLVHGKKLFDKPYCIVGENDCCFVHPDK